MKVGKTLRTLLSFFIAFAMVFPGAVKVNAADHSYPYDVQNNIILDADITGTSTNDHTYAKAFWTNGSTVYLMVESTHDAQAIVLANGGNTYRSTTYTAYPPGDTVTVDKTYYPNETQGNTKDAHLSVFEFPLSEILKLGVTGGSYAITYESEQGLGHWIYGTLKIYIPRAKVEVTKTWKDGPMDDVSIQLYRKLKDADDSTYTPVGNAFTLTTTNPSKTISDLDFTDNIGRIYTYSAKEVNLGEGYASEVKVTGPTLENGVQVFTVAIKNTYTPPKTDIKVTKVWKDDNDTSGRPSTLTYYLYADDGTEPVGSHTVNSSNWDYTFEDFPKTQTDGTLIKYSVKEAPVPGYETSIDGLTVTNTRSALTDVDVTKLWKDGDDPSGRPSIVTFNLFANGEKIDSVELTSAKSWKHTFEDLDKYDENGKLIKYTVTEDTVKGYTPTIDGLTITNLRVGKVDIPVEKFWKDDGPDGRPGSVTINLLANGDEVQEKSITAAMDWKYTFSEMDKYDENGKLITYTIKEDAVDGYKSEVKGYNVTNTKTGTTDIDVEKIWLDDNDTSERPLDGITIYLHANGSQVDSVKLTAESSWKHTFKDKPAYTTEGKAITYTITEGEVPGYTSKVEGFKVTNLRTGTTDVSVDKMWKDGNVLTARPAFITVNLLANGEEVDEMDLTAAMDWTYTFEKLDKYDDMGKLIVYTITEEEVTGYEGSVKDNEDGSFTITNTRTGVTSVSGTKSWWDEEGTSVRPESITVELLQNGEFYKSMDVSDVEGLWAYSFKELPEFDGDGVAYKYTIEEVSVEGYKTSYDGYDIFNLRTGEIDIPVEKIWLDNGERDVEEITINLYRHYASPPLTDMNTELVTPSAVYLELVETLDLNEDNMWKGTFEDLPEFDEMGYPIEYTLEEEEVEGYTGSMTMNEDGSYTFTNLRTGIVDIEGVKTWYDADEADRPEFITVILMRNGEELDRMDVSEMEGTWTYSFTDLPEFDEEGIAYLYEIDELPVEGYNTIIVGYDIQNTRTGITNVNGEKTWDDLLNRPEAITVNLLQNGVEFDDMVVEENEEGRWLYSFTDLPAFDEDGIPYTYTVEEDPLAGYESTVEGYNIMNRQLRGTLRIVKTDDFDEPIEGVIFEIEDAEGLLIDTVSTDEDGIAEVVLPLGTYTITEIFAPEDYIMDDEEKIVIIDEDGETVELTVVNILEIEEVEPLPLPTPKPKPTLPKTGAQGSFLWYGMGAILALAGFTLLRKKKTSI